MTMSVSEAVASRRSIRAFLDTPVPFATIERVMDRARWAPSGCNFQPWEATVLTGEPLAALQAVLLAAKPDDPQDYDFSAPGQRDKYQSRLETMAAAMFGSLNIARQDREDRRKFSDRNLVSFGAPVVLLVHFPRLMLAPQWSDVGMWLQTIMLLLREEGLDSCPQEWMGLYGRTISAHLGLDVEDTLLFCAIAIGHRDPDAPVNNFGRERVPLAEQVRFLGFR